MSSGVLTLDAHAILDQHFLTHKHDFQLKMSDQTAPGILFLVITNSREAFSKTGWPIDKAYIGSSTDPYRVLLNSNQDIQQLLELCFRTDQYREIRERPEFHTEPHTPNLSLPNLQSQNTPPSGYCSTQDVLQSIEMFIAVRLSPAIEAFFEKHPRLPLWNPPEGIEEDTYKFYCGLAIPNVHNQPNLLLHDMASPNPFVDDIFKSEALFRILCNTSGAGKTSLLFNGLCKYWGFYLVVVQDTKQIGIEDLQGAIDRMPFIGGWVNNIFRRQEPDIEAIKEADQANEKIVSHGMLKVLVARWLVFRTFLKVAKNKNNGKLPDSIKMDWLLFQILPIITINDHHPFIAVMKVALRGASADTLHYLLDDLTPSKVLGTDDFNAEDSFFYVLDEAQHAVTMYDHAFADADGKIPRPILRPIIRTLRDTKNARTRFIISGTGFSLDLFKKVLASGVGKQETQWVQIHRTGDFTDAIVQKAYISRYFPAPFLSSPSGAALICRMHEWLRGRHRFTATFIEELLKSKWSNNVPTSPHNLLNHYIHQYTNFHPIDGDENIIASEPVAVCSRISVFPWDKLKQEVKLLKQLSKTLWTYMLTGKHLKSTYQYWPLVEYGLARFIDENSEVTVGEPMALVAIMRWFELNDYTVDAKIKDTLDENPGQGLELEAILLGWTNLFTRKGTKLIDVVEFHGEAPLWAYEEATIVASQSADIMFDLLHAQPVSPSLFPATFANHPNDIQGWLESKPSGWCIPGQHCGPDLMAWLRLESGKLLLVLLQSKCRTSGNIKTLYAEVTADAINSLSPKKIFSTLTKPEKKKQVASMLAAINGNATCFTGATYNILRVVAAFPLKADFRSNSKAVKKALQDDQHPLASLSHSALLSSLSMAHLTTSMLIALKENLEYGRQNTQDAKDSRKKRRVQ